MIAQGKHQWRSGGPMMGRVYAFPHHRPKAARGFVLGLTSRQVGLVAAACVASFTAALVLAWWLRRRNLRQTRP